MMSNFVDLTGKRFYRWIVLGRVENNHGRRKVKYLCRCDCKTEKAVLAEALRTGHSMSCGCLQREKASKSGKKRVTHGMSDTRVYKTWAQMLKRCENTKCTIYHRYGGRGIIVCERWHSFENFLADMGEPPKGKSLDRIDNNLGYFRENCRWATRKEQNNNRRSNRWVEFNGQRKTLSEWADSAKISYSKLWQRVHRW